MGIPMALSLGIISGLLNFIPNIGPIVAAVPAILIASMEGPEKMWAVAIFYLVYQMIDGYLLTPLMEKRTVELPGALTLLAQVLLGVALGFLGVLLAVPLVACVLVLVKMIYVQGILKDRVTLPGVPKPPSKKEDRSFTKA
jgi:predicted PurR-regulated permease PerM